MWECMCRLCRNVWGDKSCKMNKESSSSRPVFILTHSSHHHYITKKDLVYMSKSSLTIWSWSMHVCFILSHFLCCQQPGFHDFYSFHKGEAFQDSQKTLWMLSFFAFSVAEQRPVFLRPEKRNAKWGHTMTCILSSDQPRAVFTWIPSQHLPVKRLTFFLTAPSFF